MNCANCNGPVKATRENYKYDECGLDYITLSNIELYKCHECGEVEVALPRIEELHRLIAKIVARKPYRLTGPEIRYLRKWLGYSSGDFAKAMDVTAETVSRWENGRRLMSGSLEKLLRAYVFLKQPMAEYPPVKLVEQLPKGEPKKPTPLKLRRDSEGDWMEAKRAACR